MVDDYFSKEKYYELTGSGGTDDSITANDIKSNSMRITTACGLYISDAAKREELKNKIAAL